MEPLTWVQTHWVEIVAVAGAVVLASRALLYALALLAHLLGLQQQEDELTAAQKWIEGIASGLKVTALNIPKAFQGPGTGDGNVPPPKAPVILLPLLLLPLLAGCVAPQTIQDAYALEGQAITQYVANGERIDKAWAQIYAEARRADLDYTTAKVTQLVQDRASPPKISLADAKAAVAAALKVQVAIKTTVEDLTAATDAALQAKAGTAALSPEEIGKAVTAIIANREKAQADTAKVVASMQRLQTINRDEIAKALRLHGTLADWLAAGVDASAIPGMIDEVGALIQTFRVPASPAP